ncbi:MAG: hypothetical protein AAF203_02560 [Pseudomonadota bacterium]
MRRLRQLLWLIFFVVVACEQASDTVVSIPSVAVECSVSENTRCNGALDGSSVRVIMSRSGCGNMAEEFDSVASSISSLSCDSSGCSATLSSWSNGNNSVTEVLTGRMDICGLFDLDSSTGESSGDIVHSSEQDIQSSETITADSWSDI